MQTREGKGSLCKSLSQTAGTWNINRHYWGKKRIKLRTIKKTRSFQVSVRCQLGGLGLLYLPYPPKACRFQLPSSLHNRQLKYGTIRFILRGSVEHQRTEHQKNTCTTRVQYRRQTFRALALRQSYWRNCGLCLGLYVESGATLLVGVW